MCHITSTHQSSVLANIKCDVSQVPEVVKLALQLERDRGSPKSFQNELHYEQLERGCRF